jgi:beta-N-acetylhexosaminidase
LTDDERAFFAAARPCGFILFKRNCVDAAQTRALVEALRESVGDALAPVSIDQEGGRVQRLREPGWLETPAAGAMGALADRDIEAAKDFARHSARVIGAQLADCGINLDFAPCLDVLFPYTTPAIGDRAFHTDPAIVVALGRAFMDGLDDFGVQTVLKHLPGHGRARLDSHYDLPTIDASHAELAAVDFVPFVALQDKLWGMLSHLLIPALDPDAPATISPKIIREIIRGELGFQGILATDDISMKALKAPVADSSRAALAAGCDIVVHCNGDQAEMQAIAAALRPMDDALWERFQPARTPAKPGAPLLLADSAANMAHYQAMLA